MNRSSKLQKWILAQCLVEIPFQRNSARLFYGKHYSPKFLTNKLNWYEKERVPVEYQVTTTETYKTYNLEKRICEDAQHRIVKIKPEFVSTRAIEATISRSITGLKTKGLILQEKKWGPIVLTEAGLLIANCYRGGEKTVSYKDYRKLFDDYVEARKRHRRPRFNMMFTPKALLNICCSDCQKKIRAFALQGSD